MEFLCEKKLNNDSLISREDAINEEESAEKWYKFHSQECLNFHSICLNFQLLAYESLDLSQNKIPTITVVTAKRMNTRKTWNTNFIIIRQNFIGLYS